MKKDKSNKSAMTGADTLVLTEEEFNTGMKHKEYRGTGELLPAGVYHTECVEAERDISKGDATNGSPRFVLRLRVVEGEHKGRVCFFRAIAHGSTAKQVLQLLEALGEDLTLRKPKDPINLPSVDDIKGQHMMAYVKASTYNGKPKIDVSVGPLPEGTPSTNGGKKSKKSKAAIAR